MAALDLPAELRPPDPWPEAPAGTRLGAALRVWAAQCPRPLVLLFDEIDALVGASLISVLRQLRDGYTSRNRGRRGRQLCSRQLCRSHPCFLRSWTGTPHFQ